MNQWQTSYFINYSQIYSEAIQGIYLWIVNAKIKYTCVNMWGTEYKK